MKKMKALSETMAAVLLIIIAIAAAAIIALWMFGFIGGAQAKPTASLALVSNRYLAGQQVVILSLTVDNPGDNVLNITTVQVTAIDAQGNPLEYVFTWTGGGWTANDQAQRMYGENLVMPKSKQTLQIVLKKTSPYIQEATAIVVLMDPAGNEITVTTNRVTVT